MEKNKKQKTGEINGEMNEWNETYTAQKIEIYLLLCEQY